MLFSPAQKKKKKKNSKPAECAECGLRAEDGAHWAYCSKFIEPDPEKRRKAAGLSTAKRKKNKKKTAGGRADLLAQDFFSSDRDIKAMRKRSSDVAPADDGGDAPTKFDKVPSGAKCQGCMEILFVDEMVVSIGRFDDDQEVYFHPACFSCSQCGELLVDLRAFVDVGKEERGDKHAEKRLFCGRHWSENHVSRCAGCDELVLQKEAVFEFGKCYHIRHFSCEICDANLTQQDTFVPRGRK